MTHGSLFSGIGGFDLGFERAGFKTVWQVEIDPFCRRVLERHFPNVPRFADIKECRGLPEVDVITGGFPCQDVSECGQRVGIGGERSGLWSEMFRLICELRPRFTVVENVPGLLDRGIGRVLGDLASIGYDCEWQSISAASFGFPHIRSAEARRDSPCLRAMFELLTGDKLPLGFVEAMMGYPASWTAATRSEMPSSRKSRNQSRKELSKLC